MTDEPRSSRPIFNATLRAAAGWLFFRVARSTVMIQIAALYRQSGSDRLEKQPIDLRRNPRDLRDGALDRVRICAQKLVSKMAEATDKYETGAPDDRGNPFGSIHLERESERIGKALSVLAQALKIIISAASAKKKLSSDK